MSSLLFLDLSGNNISGSIPSEVGELSNLAYLSLQSNALRGSIPLQLGFLTNLQRLYIEKNELSGAVPNALCSSVASIEELASDCLAEIDGDKPKAVEKPCEPVYLTLASGVSPLLAEHQRLRSRTYSVLTSN